MSNKHPEASPGDYDDVTRLRLQLHHAEIQRDAARAALHDDVLKVIKLAVSDVVDTAGCNLVELDDLKAENARLKADLQMEKENEDRLVRNWQYANNEVHGLKAQVAALIDEQTRLQAEVERLKGGRP